MSVIFGIFHKSGKPVSDELDTMYSGMKHFPHEKHAFAVKGNCAFGHMLTYNTPEALNESMPVWVEETKVLFVAEGRLDNREELFNALGIRFGEQTGMPDGTLILKAYLKWGEKCVDRLMGKWSFAAFHHDEQRLFIARDKWDYTSVDYYANDKVVAFATSSKGLFPLPFIGKELDERMLVNLLVIWLDDYEKTFYRDIRRLMASRTLRVTREGSFLNRYWKYEDIQILEGLKLEDYVEDLFFCFEKAVTARLRSCKPVAGTLSGGLDSGSVCILAAELLAKQGKRLRTFSHVPRFEPSPYRPNQKFGDERPFIEADVKASGNIDPTFLDSAGISPITGIREMIELCGEAFSGAGNAYWMADIYNTAAREGYGTMLMGVFGNITISRSGIEDILPCGEIFERYGIAGVLKKKILKPLLYGNTLLGHVYKRMRFGGQPWKNISYCTEAYEKSQNLAQRIRQSWFDPTFNYYFHNETFKNTLSLNISELRLTYSAYIGCETGLEFRDPTGDPRVIQSALSIPNRMFYGKMDKWVLRTMMKDRLPDEVRLNPRKGLQSSDIIPRLAASEDEMERILSDMSHSPIGEIIDVDRLLIDWQSMKADWRNPNLIKAFSILRTVAAYCMYERSG
jgi:asparagine synthase (glutamine-hydrolysing)